MTATTIRVQMAQRKDTAANWTAANPILLSGEIGYETDTKKFKIGNGSTNWNSLAYLPIPDGSGNLTITGNLEIGSTGSLTFEGSTADGFETTLAVTNPTADRTITLPDTTGTVITSGDTGTVTSTMLADGTIVDADVSATAEIAVSKLANGTANQVIVTDGANVSWSDDLTLAGNLTVNGTTTTINTQDLLVEDKNIIIGNVDTPTDVTADGGGITLKGATDKTINWVDATDAWTSSERFSIPLGSTAAPSLTFTGDPNTGIYSPGADQVAISTGGSGRLFVDASGRVGVGSAPSVGNGIHATINTNNYGTALVLQNTNVNGWAAEMQFLGITTTDTQAKIGALATGPGSNSGALAFYTANAGSYLERLRITSAGLVGIGTSSPGFPFQVKSTTNAHVAIWDNGGIPQVLGVNDAGGSAQLRLAGQILSFTGNGGAGSEHMRLDASGRLGIGTTSVSKLLHLAANDGNAAILLARSNSGVGSLGQVGFSTVNGTVAGIDATSVTDSNNGALRFWTTGGSPQADVTSLFERCRLTADGKFLVGTSSSASAGDSQYSKLQVRGNTSGNPQLGIISIQRDEAASAITTGEGIGEIVFTDNAGNTFAAVVCEADANAGSGDHPGRLTFSTTADGAASPTERMRIDSNGTLGVVCASNTDSLYVSNAAGAGTTRFLIRGRHGATGVYGGTESFVVYTNGNVQNTNNSYGAYSDIKLKENIVDANSQWDDLKALQVRKYNFKEGQTHTQIGLIAQEVELVSPGLVSESPDRDAEGNDLGTVTKSVNYSVLYMKAVKALQEAMERIETLEAKVAALESA